MAKKKKKVAAHRELRLHEKLAAIGVMVTADSLSKAAIQRVDLEETLVDAAVELASADAELRLLGPTLTWVAVHGSSIIIEKLIKLLRRTQGAGQDVSMIGLLALMALAHGHKRWSIVVERFSAEVAKPRLIGPKDMAESLLRLRGEEEWASSSGFRLPKGGGKIDEKWVLSPSALAKQHRQYRNLLIYGPQRRADIITACEAGASTATEASRRTGASNEPCHRVKDELDAVGFGAVSGKL